MSQYDDSQRTIRAPRDEGANAPLSPRVERTQGMGGGWSGGAEHANPLDNKTRMLQTGPASFAWLALVKGPGAGHLFRLRTDSEGNLIGRDGRCDIILDDPAVSNTHAKVRAEGAEEGRPAFYLQDLMSTNGTQVNGESVVRSRLQDGDRITLGPIELVFKQV